MDRDFQMIKTLKHTDSAIQCDKRFKGKYVLCFWKQLHAYTEKLFLWNLNMVRCPVPLEETPPKLAHCSWCSEPLQQLK